jgi:hypothetical protein
VNLITYLSDVGYEFVTFENLTSRNKQIILRHDVDFSLSDSQKMAETEAEMGVYSTYFFLLGAHFYNLFSKDGKNTLQLLIKLGHKIGLHFDASIYNKNEIASKILYERSVLQDHIQTPVNIFSFHRGSSDYLNTQNQYFGMASAYDKRFFTDIGYCSDSEGRWRHYHPYSHPCIKEKKSLQLLIHPIWWSSEKQIAPSKKLLSTHDEICSNVLASIKANTKVL